MDLARYLRDAIASHQPRFQRSAKDLKGWAVEIDRALRLDGRTESEIRRAIDFAHRSAETFWRANVLSGAKLRKQMDTILIQARPAVPEPVPPDDYEPLSADDATRNGRHFVRDDA